MDSTNAHYCYRYCGMDCDYLETSREYFECISSVCQEHYKNCFPKSPNAGLIIGMSLLAICIVVITLCCFWKRIRNARKGGCLGDRQNVTRQAPPANIGQSRPEAHITNTNPTQNIVNSMDIIESPPSYFEATREKHSEAPHPDSGENFF